MKRHEKKATKRQAREAKAKETRARAEAAAARKRAAGEALRERARQVKAPPEVKTLVRAQLARFVERFGRHPVDGEHLFFDPSAAPELGPVPLPHDRIEEAAEALGAPVELVGLLVRSGLVLRGNPRVETGRTSTAHPNQATPPREG